jgi:uncharacterized protein with von Willebrand factor type A (vWA) domain
MSGPSTTDPTLPLEQLYLHLVRAGFPLSVRDYRDALRALRLGHGVGRRDDLYTLAKHLWARGDEDVVRLDAVFRRFARPTADQVQALTGAAARRPATGDHNLVPGAENEAGAMVPPAAGGDATAAAPRAEFAAAGATGLGLPSVHSVVRSMRPYVFQPRLPLAERSLVIAWRRLRSVSREGPAVELDIDATVDRQCRTGWMLQPVLVPRRRNRARLLVLADASPSMLPWRGLFEPLADSLRQSRLASAQLLFFDNDPRDGLYTTAALDGWRNCSTTLQDQGGDYALLLLGDAGSARGRGDRSRLAGMRSFVAEARRHCQALAWVNPMPAARWGGCAHALRPAGAMFELGEEGLIRAVDHLRGLHRG